MSFVKVLTLGLSIVGLLLLPGCPGEVEITEGRVVLKDVELPDGCQLLAFYVKIEQEGADLVERGPFEIRDGQAEVGLVRGFDFKKQIKITVTVAQGVNCGEDLAIGKTFQFDGVMTHEGKNDAGENVFSVKFSQFNATN